MAPGLLPRSGVGVQPPWLVIAPQEPAIRVDLRLLDRVEVIETEEGSSLLLALGDYEVSLYVADGLDACQALASQCARYTREQPHHPVWPHASLVPCARPRLASMTGQVIELPDGDAVLGCAPDGTLTVSSSAGHPAAKLTLDPTGRCTLAEVDAASRLRINGEQVNAAELLPGGMVVELGELRMIYVAPHELGPWITPMVPDRAHFVFVGADPVIHRGNRIHIGDIAFRLHDVRNYALRGANVPLPNGGLVQAAVILFVAAAGQDADLLAYPEENVSLGNTVFTPAHSPEALSALDSGLHEHEHAADLVLGSELESDRVCGAFCVDRAGRVSHVSLEPPYVTRFVNGSIDQYGDSLEALETSGHTTPRSNDDLLALRAKLTAIDAHAFEDNDAFWPRLLRSLSSLS